MPDAPSLVRLRSVAHLLASISGTLRRPRRDGHPCPTSSPSWPTFTPPRRWAGVQPLAVALDLIGRLETTPRGQWAGPVGWIGGTGDGDWVIGIRSVTLDGPRAIAWWPGRASWPGQTRRAELAETTLKLVPVMEALVPGSSTLLSG